MAKERITKNFRFLVKSVEPMPVLDFLIERGLTDGERIRNIIKNKGKDDGNREIIDSLPRMKDGKGYQHFIDALKEEGMQFVLNRLFGTDAVTSPTSHRDNNQGEITIPKTVAAIPVENSERPESSSNSASLDKVTLDIEGCTLDTIDGVGHSRAQGHEDTVTDSSVGASSVGARVPEEHSYEHYREVPTEPEHEYDDIGNPGEVPLSSPTTLTCPENYQIQSSCPDELSALKEDPAWHAHINDRTIHKVVDGLCACPAGTYIMWYSVTKGAMLVSVSVPSISKGHVHFKMIRTTGKDGVPTYHFDQRFKSKDPVAVLKYAKDKGLIIKKAKLERYLAK